MLAKRPSKKVEHLGLIVNKGMYGFSLQYPSPGHYRSIVYKTSDECVRAALNGERPIALSS